MTRSRPPDPTAPNLAPWLPLLRRVARLVRGRLRLGAQVDVDDLVSFGAVGLLEALGRFDPALGCPLETWVRWRVVGAMYDGLRRARLLRRKGGPPLLELYADTGLPLPAARYAARQPRDDDAGSGPRSPEESLADPATSVSERVARAQMRRRLHRALGRLAPRERALLEAYYFRDTRLTHAAAAVGVSVPWASRLHARAVAALRRHLDDDEDSA
jgi:RNA polymerase sigma factor for flagellar operon FliA